VLAIVVYGVTVLAALALSLYALRRIRPGRFRFSLQLLKLFVIDVEVDGQQQSDAPDKPRELP
jgi:hypothetical protein